MMSSTKISEMFRIQVSKNGQLVALRALDKDVVTIGSHATCDVVLEGDEVSPMHALISWTSSGYRVSDMCFSCATYLNDAKVWHAALRCDDELRIGQYRIKVEWCCDPESILEELDEEIIPLTQPKRAVA
jgi:predicted component of type VI protein secretion system